MLRTIFAAAALLPLTACLAEPAEPTAEDEAAVYCGDFCDPFDYDRPMMLELTQSYGHAMFPDATQYGPGDCADLGTADHPEWDCVVSLVTTANPCGTVAVECFRSRCNWQPLDGCH